MDANPAGPRAVGIDAAGRHGWVGVVVDRRGVSGALLGGIEEIVRRAEPVDAVGIDIPIGHVDAGPRAADVEARRFVGPRASSVFAAPPAEVLHMATYQEANEALSARGRPRMSRQAWNLVPRMREAAAAAARDPRIHEVHPEVTFRVLAGEPLAWSKKSWNGLLLRRRLLIGAGLELPDVVPQAGGAAADDVVDAAAVAWSAMRIAAGTARTLPDPPQESGGRRVAIWC